MRLEEKKCTKDDRTDEEMMEIETQKKMKEEMICDEWIMVEENDAYFHNEVRREDIFGWMILVLDVILDFSVL
jgi:hypothetical protein